MGACLFESPSRPAVSAALNHPRCDADALADVPQASLAAVSLCGITPDLPATGVADPSLARTANIPLAQSSHWEQGEQVKKEQDLQWEQQKHEHEHEHKAEGEEQRRQQWQEPERFGEAQLYFQEGMTDERMVDQRPLSWVFEPNMHPMVQDSEKKYIEDCLEAIASIVEAEGGIRGLVASLAVPARRAELLGDGAEAMASPRQALWRCFEARLQQQTRTGGDSVFVQPGHIMSMGAKKILKLQLWCGEEGEEEEGSLLSICWDWSVKLEPKSQ